jgi:hypothetical protein
MAMMAITTSNSIRVKPGFVGLVANIFISFFLYYWFSGA